MIRRAYVCSTILALALLAGGCQAIRDAGGDAARAALDATRAYLAEHKGEIKEELKEEGKKLLTDGAKEIGVTLDKKLDERLLKIEANLSGHGVEGKIESLVDAFAAYRKVREEEERSGKPYQPITGNLLVDIMVALFGTRYLGKGVDKAAAKIMKQEAK